MDSWRDSDHIGGLKTQIGPFWLKNHNFWKQARVSGCGVALQGQFFLKMLIFLVDVWCFLKVLKSWDSEPGTPLERSGSKFRFKSRARELRSIYGDPFGEDFVPIRGHKGSGPGSHTFVCGRHTVSLCGRHTGQMCGRAVVREQLQPHWVHQSPLPTHKIAILRCRVTSVTCP